MALVVTLEAPSPRAPAQGSAWFPTALLAHPCSLPIEPYLVGKLPSQRCLWAQQIRAEAGSPCHNGLAATGVAALAVT